MSCAQNELRQKIAELDSELETKDVHMARFNARMDSLRLCLACEDMSDSLKWETAYAMFSAYSYVNVDSTIRYLGVLASYASTPELAYRSDVCRMRSYAVEQNYDELFAALADVNPERVSAGFRQRYFDELQRAFVLCPDHDDVKKDILRRALAFEGLSEDVRMRYEGLLLLYDERFTEALPYFASSFDLSSNDHIKALAAYNQAFCYNHLGDETRYCVWLAQAAIYDIRVPVSEYMSLVELADALFERGDYDEASRYIQVVLGDAIEGRWDSRIHLSAVSQNAIFKALDSSRREFGALMMAFILFLMASVAIVLALLYMAFRQNRNLRYLNEAVTSMNTKLKDEGRIKENYLFKYMEMSVQSLGRLDDYRLQVRQVLKDEGPDALMTILRSPRSRVDYKEFYDNFDKTFLSLYPDFIKQVNSLMKEGCKFPQSGSLSTDLRILATVRLGFVDSGQIARFLNMPSTSIYTRRSALRRNSLCEREDFDEKIRQIV